MSGPNFNDSTQPPIVTIKNTDGLISATESPPGVVTLALTAPINSNIDGGHASSVYLSPTQVINGGNA